MSHVITETAVFTPSVTVPDGTDTMVAAAEQVAAIAQALGNRTQYLKPRADGAAQRAAANTFTQANTFDAAVTINAPLVVGAGAPLTVEGGATIDGNLDVNGNSDVLGGDFRVLNGHHLVSTGEARITGNVLVASGSEVRYSGTLAARSKQIALGKGLGNFNSPNANVRAYGSADWLMNWGGTSDGFYTLPIELPSLCQLASVDVIYDGGPSSGAFSFRVIRKPISDWGATPAAPSGGTIISSAAALSGQNTATVNCGNYAIDNSAESYVVSIIFNDTYDSGFVQGVRVNFADYGLNNR